MFRRGGAHPAVDLELLWMGRLLRGDSLRTGSRGGERPDTTSPEEGGRGLGDGLHGCQTRITRMFASEIGGKLPGTFRANQEGGVSVLLSQVTVTTVAGV